MNFSFINCKYYLGYFETQEIGSKTQASYTIEFKAPKGLEDRNFWMGNEDTISHPQTRVLSKTSAQIPQFCTI